MPSFSGLMRCTTSTNEANATSVQKRIPQRYARIVILALLNNFAPQNYREAVFNRVNFILPLYSNKKKKKRQAKSPRFFGFYKAYFGGTSNFAYLNRTAFVRVTSPCPSIDTVSGKVPSELKLSIPKIQVSLLPLLSVLTLSDC